MELPPQAPPPIKQDNTPPPLPPGPEKGGVGRQVFGLIKKLAVLYIVVLIAMYFLQSYFIYRPDSTEPGSPRLYHLGPDVQEISVETEDGLTLSAWWVPPDGRWKPVVVHFHGNAGNRGDRSHIVSNLMKKGYGILLTDYRGYGGNQGTPSEEALYTDARAYITWLTDAQGYNRSDLILYGESLGSAVAIQMGKDYPTISAMILEGSFGNLTAVGKKHYPWLPVGCLLKDKYQSDQKINFFNGPVLFVHGTADQVVPIAFGRALYDSANHPKTWIEIEGGGHNDLYERGLNDHIIDFLRDVSPKRGFGF